MKVFVAISVFIMTNGCDSRQNTSPNTSLPHLDETEKLKCKEKPYANPAYGNGCDFGHILQAFYRQNKYKELLKFTCTQTRKKFGDKQLIGFYEDKFHMDFELGKLTSMQTDKDTINLIFSKAQLLGTRRKIVIPVIVENDSCKIIIKSLATPFKFINE